MQKNNIIAGALMLISSNQVFAETINLPNKESIILYASFTKEKQPEINKTNKPLTWQGNSKLADKQGVTGKCAAFIGINGYIEIDSTSINSDNGTIAFWLKPAAEATGDTHTYLSWGWDIKKSSYMVFSQPWYNGDPSAGGPDKTYFVFDNKKGIATAFTTNIRVAEWTFYALTWKKYSSDKILISAYQNGIELTSRIVEVKDSSYKTPATPIFLGTDIGTNVSKGRWLNGFINDFILYDKAIGLQEIKSLFLYHSSSGSLKDIYDPSNWMNEVKELQPQEKRNENGTLLESRMIMDESNLLLFLPEIEMKKELNRIKNAGFNVIMPCVWHGNGMECESEFVIKSERYNKVTEKQKTKDPFGNLLKMAHEMGMEVHPFYTIMTGRKSPYNKFKIQDSEWHNGYDPEFRDFIVSLVLENIKKYNIDGINLDYVRIQKGLDTPAAASEYKRIHGRDLQNDRNNSDKMAEFTGYCVNDIVSRISAGARKIKPDIVISVSSHLHPREWGIPASGRNSEYWLQKGWIDIIYNMDYGQKLSITLVDKARKESEKPFGIVELLGNYDFVEGKCMPRNPELFAGLVDYCRKKYNDGNGIGVYWINTLSDEQIEALRKGPFKENAKPSWRK